MIELPKDADGREIPLDTVCMYDCNGDSISIARWSYLTRLEPLFSEKNIWIALDTKRCVKDPALLHLTPPDSWEKLEEDLDGAANDSQDKARGACCAWFHAGTFLCADCPADESPDDSCDVQMLQDIASRIRKLRGDDDA